MSKRVELFRDYAEFKAFVEECPGRVRVWMSVEASPSGSGWWAIVIAE